MANATARVPTTSYVPYGQITIKRTAADALKVFYPNAMVAFNASGLEVACDDTAGITFDGFVSNLVDLNINTTGQGQNTDVANYVMVEQPYRVVMSIATAVTRADIGRKVYAKDDQTVDFTTSNSIFVGWIDDVDPYLIGGTITTVRIMPSFAGLAIPAIASNTLTFTGSTGANTIVFPDNLADALSLKQGSISYLTFVTTDGSEAVNIKGPAATSVTNAGGAINATAGTGGTTSGTGGTVTIAGGAGGAGATVGTGGAVSVTGGASTGSGAGGAASLVGGAGGLVSTGGAALITGGAGGATSGNGGAVTITGGAGAGTSGVGGVAGMTGGAGIGASAGGVGKVVGGLGGITGAGGAAQLTGGAGGATSGTGGAATIAGGAGTGTSAVGGAASITGGASAGVSGTAGTASIDAGAATGGTKASVNISDVNALSTYINRGPLQSIVTGLTLTALGTTQSSTPTIAQLLGGVITQSGTSAGGTITLPTGTAISAGMPRTPVVGDSFLTYFSSTTGGQILTITGQTGSTVLGTAAIPIGRVATMMFINTGSNAWSVLCMIGA